MDNSNIFGNHKGLLLTHLNVRSIWNKIDLLRNLFEGKKVDIISFSETWLNVNIIDEMLDFKGYNLIRNDRKWTDADTSAKAKKGGGICTYIREGLSFILNVIPNLNVSTVDIECQCCEIVLANQKNTLFMNTYRPPQGNVDTFVKSVDQALENIDTNKEDIIMMGDFNIDFLDKSNNDTKSMNRLVSENGLIKLINAATRYSVNKNSCIDQIITNSKHILDG